MLVRFLRHGLAGLEFEGSGSLPSAGAHVETGGGPGGRRRGEKPKQGLEFRSESESNHQSGPSCPA